ncbi:MAG: AraC family transcriptional regulator [Opitutaceae bacterium]|jgi:AraC-like DNA-binding protein
MARSITNGQKSPVCVQKAPIAENKKVVARERGHGMCADLQLRLLLCVTAELERWSSPNLAAPYWRLYLMKGTGAGVRWDGRTVELSPDKAWLIAPDTAFGAELRMPVTQVYVHFTLVPGLVAERGVHEVPLTAAMRRACVRGQRAKTPEEGGVLWSTLVLLALGGLPAGVLSERQVEARVARVQAHIEREPGGAHTLETLARVAGMHERALIRLFRKETGDTPMAWLRARRVSLACELLHHGDRKIDDIATAVGFCDRYHFSKTFMRLREMPPAAFRAMQRGGGQPVRGR